jgi:hypothetical protein
MQNTLAHEQNMKLKLVTYYRTWPITLAAVAHLAEGQFLQEEQTVNRAKSRIHRAGTRRQ